MLTYLPDEGVLIESIKLEWGAAREDARQKFLNVHEEKDSVTDLGQYGGGVIVQKCDVYQNFNGAENFFFLNYDEESRLTEIELHSGFEIFIGQARLAFGMDISDVAKRLKSLSDDIVELAQGEYFFKELKLTIASADAMGGDGNELSYFFCAKNIDHLLEDK